MNEVLDVIIVGAGPAGISAAIQLKRYGIKFLLLEKESIGGLLKNASLVENYLGFPKGITGIKIITLFKKHLSELNIGIKKENVLNVNYSKNIYTVKTDRNIFHAKNIIIASGTKHKSLSAKGSGSVKIYYEIHKLSEVHNKEIAIVGGGDAAFDYAVSLSRNNNRVSIIHRNDKPVCIPALLKKVLPDKNISYFCNLKVDSVHQNNGIIFSECINVKNSRRKIFVSDILVAAIGREPLLDFIKNGNLKKTGYLKGKSLYYTGDVKNKIFRQAAISIGDGIRTAMEISQKLKKRNEDYS